MEYRKKKAQNLMRFLKRGQRLFKEYYYKEHHLHPDIWIAYWNLNKLICNDCVKDIPEHKEV